MNNHVESAVIRHSALQACGKFSKNSIDIAQVKCRQEKVKCANDRPKGLDQV